MEALLNSFKCTHLQIIMKYVTYGYRCKFCHIKMQVPLGVIFKNENENAEMLGILQQFQTYLPKITENTFDPQLLTGDQLSVERAVNVIASVSNGFSAEERLEGFNLQIGDWHAAVKFLTVSFFVISPAC